MEDTKQITEQEMKAASEARDLVDNIRTALGTLPGRDESVGYNYVSAYDEDATYIKITESTPNPYKNIVRASVATWGDGYMGPGHGATQKWEQLEPRSRFAVVLAALTGQTLPQALEGVSYGFEINGMPRSSWDQLVRARIGATHASIGTRDNGKNESAFVLYPDLMDKINKEPEFKEKFDQWVHDTKDLYKEILGGGHGSYQMARAVLPMSLSHGGYHTFSLATLRGQMANRLQMCEEAPIVFAFWKLRSQINDITPLIANYMRPGCDWAQRCTYLGKEDGMTKYFSALFDGCGRWESDLETEYSEFNHSCSDPKELREVCEAQGIDFMERDDWITFTESDYDKLDPKDKALFEQP